MNRVNIDTFLSHVDVADTLLREQIVQCHIQIENFLADLVTLKDSDLLQFLEIFSSRLTLRYPGIYHKLAFCVRLVKKQFDELLRVDTRGQLNCL